MSHICKIKIIFTLSAIILTDWCICVDHVLEITDYFSFDVQISDSVDDKGQYILYLPWGDTNVTKVNFDGVQIWHNKGGSMRLRFVRYYYAGPDPRIEITHGPEGKETALLYRNMGGIWKCVNQDGGSATASNVGAPEAMDIDQLDFSGLSIDDDNDNENDNDRDTDTDTDKDKDKDKDKDTVDDSGKEEPIYEEMRSISTVPKTPDQQTPPKDSTDDQKSKDSKESTEDLPQEQDLPDSDEDEDEDSEEPIYESMDSFRPQMQSEASTQASVTQPEITEEEMIQHMVTTDDEDNADREEQLTLLSDDNVFSDTYITQSARPEPPKYDPKTRGLTTSSNTSTSSSPAKSRSSSVRSSLGKYFAQPLKRLRSHLTSQSSGTDTDPNYPGDESSKSKLPSDSDSDVDVVVDVETIEEEPPDKKAEKHTRKKLKTRHVRDGDGSSKPSPRPYSSLKIFKKSVKKKDKKKKDKKRKKEEIEPEVIRVELGSDEEDCGDDEQPSTEGPKKDELNKNCKIS
ncbi:Tash protein PEST motif family protein [Theileria parva strain Muguga]|uniref:Tash1 protein n=1 Tax=Theileria parva TaxID=5875 RepID=Q4N323_THEPA|nr:Tash protein PEST motif family protein [Theileria parva strain Muguga]EAN31516.1 Tash protein PEST motif family protein [Theileria parva strain Muguga]|eukprot:XP_763799.1 hypothetical protein [Theileria parva strain Muguga]